MGGPKEAEKSLPRARVVVDIIGQLIYINHRLDCPRKMNKFLFSVSAALVASVTVFAAHAQGVQGDIKAGEKKNAMCIGCHGIVGYQASFPEIHKVPKISGQGGKYITSALNAYKKGERKHASMRGIADSLTDQDIADLAAYYEASGAVEGAPALAKAPEASDKVNALLTKGACASCHGADGKRIRMQDLPNLTRNPGAAEGFGAWPAYRVSSGELWSMQRRLNDCFRQQRFPYPDYASDVTVALSVFMGVNGKGGTSTAPAIKR